MKKLIKNTVFFILWLFFIFILLEMAGFFYFEIARKDMRVIGAYGYPAGIWAAHKDLGYIYTKNFKGKFSGEGYFNVAIEINETGFRDSSFSNQKKVMNIAVLGDSVVFGSGVAAEARFTNLLNLANIKFRNLGVNSYTFGHYLTLLKKDFLGLKAQGIILGFTLNDIEVFDLNSGKNITYQRPHGLKKRIEKAFDRMYAVRFMQELFQQIGRVVLAKSYDEEYHTTWMRSVDNAWHKPEIQKRLTKEIQEFKAIAQNLPFIFILFPEKNEVIDPETFGYARKTLTTLLKQQEIAYCDIYPRFVEKENIEELYLPHDSVHFTAACISKRGIAWV